VKRSIRSALGAARYDEAYASGSTLSISQLISGALGTGSVSAGRAGRLADSPSLLLDRPAAPLSPRELEVARVVAEGATNGETARRLFISERTVESHLATIFSKLGVDSRVQVARWVAQLEAAERAG
jgi:non-specific serine/threonine protein kinase